MVSFVEQATLKVDDQSSGEIKKINSALRSLFRTVSKLKSTTTNIEIKTKGLAQATSMIKGLARDARALKSTTASMRVNLNATAAQRTLAQLRAQARMPIPMTLRGGALPPQPPGTGRGRNLVGRGADYLRGEAAHEIFRAVKDGVNDSTMGESSLKLKQLDRVVGPGTENAARKAIAEIGREKAGMPGGALMSAGQRAGLFSEALGVTNLNVEAAKGLTSGMEELVRSGVVLGQSFDDAREAAINYGKAAEMMGRTTFHNAEEAAKAGKKVGDFDAAGLQKTFDYFQKLQPEIGKEMTGTFTKQIAKYLGSARFAMSDRAIGAVMMLGEEEGTRAAVGFRQATKQLSGQGLKKQQLKNLIEAGLVNTEEVKKESRKGHITTTTEATGAKDREMLAKDLPRYVAKYIAPQAEKFKLDITKPEDAVALAQKFVSDTTAVETIAALLYRSKEIQNKLDTVDKREGGADIVRRLTQQDVRATMTGLSNQLQSATGEAVMAMAPAFTPILQGLSAQMQSMGETIKAATAGDKEAQAKITTGALATAAFGLPAAKMAAQVMAPLVKPLGILSGLQAMTSQDPSARALGAAGEALIGAASELDSAAAALSASALVGKDKSTIGQIVDALGGAGGPLGAVAKVAQALIQLDQNLPPPEPLTPSDMAKAVAAQDRAKADTERRTAEANRDMIQRGIDQLKLEAASADRRAQMTKDPRTKKALIAERDARKVEIDQLQQAANSLTSQLTALAVKLGSIELPDWAKTPEKPKPPADTKNPFGDPTKPSSAADINAAAENVRTSTSAFSTSFLQGTSALQSTAATFPEVFNTGAATIGQSGTNIVSTLSGAAPGIGAIIGNAAGAALKAAASSITINVNANVTGAKNATADKGGQSPD